MGGIKFLITLVVIYLVFRSVMRKIISTVNPEGGDSPKRGKLGDIIAQMKEEMERARLEAEREAAGEEDDFLDDDPWADLREDAEPLREETLEADSDAHRPLLHERWDEEDERPELHERWDEEDERPALHERWNATDESDSLWDSSEERPAKRRAQSVTPAPEDGTCARGRKRRTRLKEAIVWKEILDRPVGLRS
ncbi:hypothetical protein [Desulfoluna butyratoxydans]|uniref:Uncharacterized protein n=1 Tax=Desulfoluna butyratoxydans TaxID=231438 RepID=A0A4U8YIV0_9BACT|nr:hypothetical protein [Desulfoluna butyratoxydans]VFQ43605.1 hypothetical protein MSL71_12400 [Desulfoluna butyratoxydans]